MCAISVGHNGSFLPMIIYVWLWYTLTHAEYAQNSRFAVVCCVLPGEIFSNVPLHWRHNDHDDVSNHQPHGCLLNRLFRRRSKKTSKLRVTGLCVGNSPGPVNSPHKGPVTRKMFPFDDVIMLQGYFIDASRIHTIAPVIWKHPDKQGYTLR